MNDKIKSILTWLRYGFCGVGVAVLTLVICVFIYDGMFTLDLYMKVLGLGNNAMPSIWMGVTIIGFLIGLVVRRVELNKEFKSTDSVYVDIYGNEYEIIKGVKDKDGIPHIIVMDYPKKDSATIYTLEHFNNLFRKKEI
jgi:hypothetical protein